MPVQMTPATARVIDPVLTTVAQGFKNPAFVGMSLFPAVPVNQRGGKIITFNAEDFELYSTGRAPGQNTKRVQFGYSGSAFALDSHSLEGQVPIELMQEANAVPGIDMSSAAVRKTQNIIGLRLEKAQADLATTAGNYDSNHKLTSLTGTSLWSDLVNSNPSGAIETAKEAIRTTIGMHPTTIIMGAKVMAALRQHTQLLDRVKYTSRDNVTEEILARLWGVDRVLVGSAIYKDASGAFVDVWGKSVVIAYTDISGIADMGSPSFGYTYRLGGYPIVEQAYQDRSAKSWIYPVTDEVSPVIAGATAGYLISPAVA